jgi:large subunit ribosomal protein L21
MKSNKILKQAKKSARNHYVSKKDFKKLLDEVTHLRNAVRNLEECCGEGEPALPEPNPRQPKTAKRSAPTPANSGAADQRELERINGIGPVLAGKLNALGITSIGQVAKFTQADIDRISENLNFKGRIERDEWVQQAQKLVEN